MPAVISLDDKKLRKLLDKVDEVLGDDVRPIWREFAQYMRTVTDNTFKALRHGGTYRGVQWDYFADQYTRKSGVTVPAWGGVPKVRGRGVVKGRKRASGARVSAGDSIVQDSMVLRGEAALVLTMSPGRLRMGTNLSYAKHQARWRPFLFFTEKDAKEVVNIAVRRLQQALKSGI